MDGAQPAAAPAAVQGSSRPQIDDRGALLLHHIAKIKPLIQLQEKAAQAKSAADKAVTEAYNYATADIQCTRKWLAGKIEASGRSHRDLIEERALDDWANGVLGIPIQGELDLGGKSDDAAADAIFAHFQGYQDGVGGFANDPTRHNLHPAVHQQYSQGWISGQAVLAMGLARGEELAKQAGEPQTGEPVDLNGEDGETAAEGLGDDDRERLDAQAGKLRSSGFLETESGAGTRKREAGGIKLAGQAKKAAEAKAGVH